MNVHVLRRLKEELAWAIYMYIDKWLWGINCTNVLKNRINAYEVEMYR